LSPLTKALVVLVTLLAVLELGMFVAYSAKHTDLAQQLGTAQSNIRTAEESARAARAELAAAQEGQSQVHAELTAQIAALTAKLTDAVTAQRTAESQIQAERARNEKTEQAIARLTAAAQQDAVLREALNSELKTSRSDIVDLRQKNIELTDAVNALTSTGDSQVRQLRRYAEQLAEANQRVDLLESTLSANQVAVPAAGAAIASGGAVAPPEQPISGTITQVDSSAGTTLVAVNVGANDGVAKGMEFLVHRGNTYLGKLVIDNVDANVAAGRMTLVKGSVQANDAIYAGPIGG